MNKILSILTVGLFSLHLSAQAEIENRIEIERDGVFDNSVLSFGKEGFLLTNEEIINKHTRKLNFEFYSTDLESQELVKKEISKTYIYEKEFKTDNKVYQLHRDKRNNFVFITLDVNQKKVSSFDGVLPKKMKLSEMYVLNDVCYMSGYYYGYFNKDKFLVTIDLKSKKVNTKKITIPGVKSKNFRLNKIQFLEEENEIFLAYDVYRSRNNREVHLIKIDKDGDTDQFEIKGLEKGEEKLVTYSFSKIGDEAYCITGTYSKSSSSSSQGLFFGILDDKKLVNLRFYNFLDLDDFLSYLPERKQEKIEKKKKKKKKRGKEMTISYYIAGHDVMVQEDGTFLFVGEAYYPTYRTVTTTNSDGTVSTQQVFDGYQYTHAVVAKFDLEGELLWDNCFKMYPGYKPFYEKRFLSFTEESDKNLGMIFTSGTSIISKSVHMEDGSITREKESNSIEFEESEKVKYSSTNLSYWFEDSFLLFGNQTIKDKDGKFGKKKRSIFFISKVNYEI